jgi:hypothetical protein
MSRRDRKVKLELTVPQAVALLRDRCGTTSHTPRVCHDTLDFIQVPGFPSAIRVFALTHSRRIVFQR